MMKDRAVFRIAASSLIIAATMVGCSGAAVTGRVDANAGKIDQMAGAQAKEAEKALHNRDIGRAITLAEAAVAAAPQNADYRSLLGRMYMADGRYRSAETTFEDALTLGSNDSRTIVNLSLARGARGSFSAAQDVLSAHMDKLSAADYGLAMAMAGNPEEAIRLLSQAIYAPGATAKERQNLAYAHALAGHWVEARQVASLDLPPAEAAKRVMQWAQHARPDAGITRIIAMTGAAPRDDDAGLPAALTLNPVAGQSVNLAAHLADDATPAQDRLDGDRAMLAAVADEQRSEAPLPAPYGPSGDGPVVMPVALPVITDKDRVPNMLARQDVAPSNVGKAAPHEMAHSGPVDADKASRWVVQLGSFSTPQAVRMSHRQLVKRNTALADYPVITSQVQIAGKSFHRLAIAGFSNQADARKLCATIRARKEPCFVRQGGAEASPARWAKAVTVMNKQRVAMR